MVDKPESDIINTELNFITKRRIVPINNAKIDPDPPKEFYYTLNNFKKINLSDFNVEDIKIMDSYSKLNIYRNTLKRYVIKVFILSMISIALIILDVLNVLI